MVESLDDRGVKGILKGDMESTEKWNKLFVYLSYIGNIIYQTLLTLLERLRTDKAN